MSNANGSFWRSTNGLAAILLIAAVLYFLLAEHRAHFLTALPWLILLLCPVLHIFMHGGHGHGGHSDDHQQHREDES